MPDNAAPTPLDPATLSAALNDLPLWRLDAEGKALRRDIRFADFSAAFAFMTRVALLAEAAPQPLERVQVALREHLRHRAGP